MRVHRVPAFYRSTYAMRSRYIVAQLWWSLGSLVLVLGAAAWHARRREAPRAAGGRRTALG